MQGTSCVQWFALRLIRSGPATGVQEAQKLWKKTGLDPASKT